MPLGWYFFDNFQSYEWVWIVSIGLAFLAAAFSWLIRENSDDKSAAHQVAA